jgi:hypothetical protein
MATTKQFVKLTFDGLNLLTVMNFNSIAEMSGFYGKEIFLSEGFSGNVQYLFQALGNLGAHPQSGELNNDASVVVISNTIMESLNSNNISLFIGELEKKLNQNSSPYRRMKFISENHLIWNIENRMNLTGDDNLKELIMKYKKRKNQHLQQNLFE